MKIEKVNENQIRCTLTREDFADRQLKLSELAYGSEKAKELFRDMIQQANYEFGFEVNDIPLMVEAIPLSSDSIILVITKIEYPEELDTRFSKFSEPDEEYFDEYESDSAGEETIQGADDILDLFRKIQQEHEKLLAAGEEKAGKSAGGEEDNVKAEEIKDLVKMFEAGKLEEVERIAHMIDGVYEGENDLYKDGQKNKFYLLLHKSGHTPVEFNKVCNMISEYARQKNYTSAIGAFLQEHGTCIIKGNAVQVLSSL